MADDSDIFETIPSKPLVLQAPQTANFGAKQSEPVADGVFETIPAAPKTVPQTEPTSVEMPASDIMGNPLGGTEMVAKPSKREAEDFRTVAEMPVGGKAMFGLMFSSTPQGAENIIRQHVPEAKFDVDEDGDVSFSLDCESSKIDAAFDTLVYEFDNEPTLLLTDSRKFADVVTHRINERGIGIAKSWHGKVNQDDREQIKKDFVEVLG